MSITVISGAPIFAPIAEGTPKPIVPTAAPPSANDDDDDGGDDDDDDDGDDDDDDDDDDTVTAVRIRSKQKP